MNNIVWFAQGFLLGLIVFWLLVAGYFFIKEIK